MPEEVLEHSREPSERMPSPELSPAEMADYAETEATGNGKNGQPVLTASSVFLRRTLFGLLGIGTLLLMLVLLLELVETVQVLMQWPLAARLPILGIFVVIFGYLGWRISRLLLRWRRLPKVRNAGPVCIDKLDAAKREALCLELRKRLEYTLQYLRSGRGNATEGARSSEDETGRDHALEGKVTELLEAGMEAGSRGWLERYRELEVELAAFARREVTRVARTAGLSAALSPWRLLDAAIGFNASFEAADRVLRCFGIRPDREMVMGFAFDAFVTTFFSTAAEQVLEDLSADLAADLHSSLAKVLGEKVAPKVAEGLAVALFVRRVGRRMVRRMKMT
ncbi:MAG: DUF697 domain-containing protein [Verrucomicrobia bacterium]|nr:DUF697 domain-containing protein [Verrucomicrobiota bacterium]